MIKGIIFDLDGTTLSTLYDIQDSINFVFRKEGYKEQTYDEVRLHVGRGSRNLIKDSLPSQNSEKEIDRVTDLYLEKYRKDYNIKTKPFEGIPELLKQLNSKGIKLAINSNKPDEITKKLIAYHFPGNIFMSIIGSRKGVPNKPDPFSANQIVQEMNLDKNEVLYVGDSETDMKTAKNANLKAVGCLWGFRDLETLKRMNADIIISSPKELLNYL